MEIFGIPHQAFLGQLMLGLVNGAFYAMLSLGLAVIFGIVFAVRAWWFRRKFRGGPPFDGGSDPAAPGPKPAQKRLIEGEYVVVNEPDAETARRQR